MEDPRQTLNFSGTTVGDVAFFVLVDNTGIDFLAPLPPEVKQDYKNEGVYAYFRFVEAGENRLILQKNLNELFNANEHKAQVN